MQSACGMSRIQLVELALFPSPEIGMASFRLVGVQGLCDNSLSDILGGHLWALGTQEDSPRTSSIPVLKHLQECLARS